MKKHIVIFDLDGTLANIDHRLHYIETAIKQWDKFNHACVDDTPIEFTCELLRTLKAKGFTIYIVTGRSSDFRFETVQWLSNNNLSKSIDKLIMRPSKLKTEDFVWKKSLVDEGKIKLNEIQAVFEDRSSVVEMWRSLNLQVYQVADGNF